MLDNPPAIVQEALAAKDLRVAAMLTQLVPTGVGAGAPVVVWGSGVLLGGLTYQLNPFPTNDRNSAGIAASLIGATVATTVYGGWAAYDAFQTAERLERAMRASGK